MPLPRMYRDLAPWWHLLSPPSDYAEEAAWYQRAIEEHSRRPVRTLLELGSGGGNNAGFLKGLFAMTLVDVSPDMQAVSRELNPELEHVLGDMRTVRLGRRFDAVLIHDAIAYMTTEDDLAAAIATAAEHVEPGGLCLFVPDDIAESYRPVHSSGGTDDGPRGIRYLQWAHAPRGTTVRTTFVYVLVDGDGPPQVEWEDHVTGIFPRATWLALIELAGLEPLALPYEHSEFDTLHEMFAGIAPA